jgi:hypothetical protein
MSTVDVFVYGFKSKGLPDSVKQLLENQSGTNSISVIVYDQTNLSRNDKFSDVKYNHIQWDNMVSKFKYLKDEINSSTAEYFMYIDGDVYLEKNWDMELVMGHGGRDIVMSGNHALEFDLSDYKFYTNYKMHHINTTIKTSWIKKELMFMSTERFKSMPNLSLLKHNGIEEIYSLFCALNNIEVYAIATAWYRTSGSIFDNDFIPFSPNSNYNLVIDTLRSMPNRLFPVPVDVGRLSNLVGYDFQRLSRLPFERNDIEYDPTMNLDAMASERFHGSGKSMY